MELKKKSIILVHSHGNLCMNSNLRIPWLAHVCSPYMHSNYAAAHVDVFSLNCKIVTFCLASREFESDSFAVEIQSRVLPALFHSC